MHDLVPQMLLSGFVLASRYALVGTGFFLILALCRFIHFAHGAFVPVAAYSAFVAGMWLSMPVPVCALAGIVVAAALGCLMELSVYRPLRRKRASTLILMLASIGIYAVLQNSISLVFGDDTKSIRSGVVEEGLNVLGARITPIQITTICVSIALVIALALFLRNTKIGQAMRAVANDPELASVSGIDSDRVILWAFAIGSALAGVAGILVALDVDMTPTMGLNALMMGVVAVIIGGANSIPGIALGALLLGMAQQFGVWWISSQWQDAIAFIILLAFLLFRPQGFMGRKVKKAVV